jgi:hypothetical protein
MVNAERLKVNMINYCVYRHDSSIADKVNHVEAY